MPMPFSPSFLSNPQILATYGQYFIARTPTPGTGIVLSPTTGVTFSDTQGLLVVDNQAAVNGNTIILDFVAIIVTAAPTGTTVERFSYAVDTANRGASGTLLTVNNSNLDHSSTTIAGVRGGQPTIAAASGNVRRMGESVARTGIGAIGDLYMIRFGGQDMPAQSTLSGTNAQQITVYAAPVLLRPGDSFVLNEWATGRTAAFSGELVVGYVER